MKITKEAGLLKMKDGKRVIAWYDPDTKAVRDVGWTTLSQSKKLHKQFENYLKEQNNEEVY